MPSFVWTIVWWFLFYVVGGAALVLMGLAALLRHSGTVSAVAGAIPTPASQAVAAGARKAGA